MRDSKKKKPEPKIQKQGKSSQKSKKRPSGSKTVFAATMVVVGMILNFRALAIFSQEGNTALTNAQLTEAARLQEEMAELTAHADALPEIDNTVLKSIKEDTRLSQSLQDSLCDIASDCGLQVVTVIGFEKQNEHDVVKASYQLEGTGTTTGITSFLGKVQDLSEALLIEEVYLSEGPVITTAGGESRRGGTESFRIVLEHSHTIPRSAAQEGFASVLTRPVDNQQAHTHTFGDVGWVTAPTHDSGGETIKICTVCKEEVREVTELTGDEHTWGDGSCGQRNCSVCGALETEANHLMSLWTVTSEPTCYLIGYRQRTCINPNCNYAETEDVAKLEHAWVEQNEKTICNACGEAKNTDFEISVV